MGKLHMPLQERFLKYVEKLESCWEWRGARSGDGYGTFQLPNKLIGAHRMAYILYKGEIPAGLCVCHKCDNPICINPEHLFLGTVVDNNRDRDTKGRGRKITTVCPRGHQYTEENTYRSGRYKDCRKCRVERTRRYYARNKEL